jgi:NADP-dependent 3-hydroxy acid dehydrogenase YdfG
MPDRAAEVVVITGASAGIGGAIAVPADSSPEDYRHVTDVTCHGFVWGATVAHKRMRARDRGASTVRLSIAAGCEAPPRRAWAWLDRPKGGKDEQDRR